MKSLNLFTLLGIALLSSLFFVSCSDDDSITQEEKETAIETSANYEINNRSLTTDAYAAYCMENGKEMLVVSNNIDLLGGITQFDFNDLDVDDFVFQYVNDPGNQETYTIGGSVFGETIGLPNQQNLFDVGTVSNISSNDGSTVIGSMSGTYIAFDDNLEPFTMPYALRFTANIVQTSDFCN